MKGRQCTLQWPPEKREKDQQCFTTEKTKDYGRQSQLKVRCFRSSCSTSGIQNIIRIIYPDYYHHRKCKYICLLKLQVNRNLTKYSVLN